MALKAAADNNRVANPVADTGRYVFFSCVDPYSRQALWKLRNDIFQLSNNVPATVYSWTVGSAHFLALQRTIRRGGVHIVYQQTLRRCLANRQLPGK
jgi:hypothetical protein